MKEKLMSIVIKIRYEIPIEEYHSIHAII